MATPKENMPSKIASRTGERIANSMAATPAVLSNRRRKGNAFGKPPYEDRMARQSHDAQNVYLVFASGPMPPIPIGKATAPAPLLSAWKLHAGASSSRIKRLAGALP